MRLVAPVASSACEHKWVRYALACLNTSLPLLIHEVSVFDCSSGFGSSKPIGLLIGLLAWLLAVYCQLV